MIHITNGEGCSLGLSKTIKNNPINGYDETTIEMQSLLTFIENYDEEIIENS